jgi:hypothetical protein
MAKYTKKCLGEENANQNYIRISLQSDCYFQKQTNKNNKKHETNKTNACNDVEKKETLNTVGGNVNYHVYHYGKQYGVSL